MKLAIDTVEDDLLPDEIDVLGARDMCRGSYDGPQGTHCLLGWSWQIEGSGWWMHDSVEQYISSITGDSDLASESFNDNPNIPIGVSARLFNTVAARRFNVPKSACLTAADKRLIKKVFAT